MFVVAGQSNAQGYNHTRQYRGGREPFPESLRVQPRILFWPGIDVPAEKDVPAEMENRWTELRVGDSGAFGPEIAFAGDLERLLPDSTIAIVKFAAGGTGIARSADYTDYIPALAGFDDKNRNWHPPTDGREAGALYRSLIANVRSALSKLEGDGRKVQLSGLVWMQGEHEAGISRKMAEDYERLLGEFIASVRKDLQAPSLPFAIGQVNSHSWVYGDIARHGQAEVCRRLDGAVLVETLDLPRVSGDAAHFTADGMLTLGSRFATGMAKLLAAGDARAGTPAARTWLPAGDASGGAAADPSTLSVNEFLKPLAGHFRPLICRYSGSQLAVSRSPRNGELQAEGAGWHCDLKTDPVSGEPDALDMTLGFRLSEGSATNAGVAAAFDFAPWSRENYVLVPAAVYNGNRFRVVNSGYCAPFPKSDCYDRNLALTISDSPRLSRARGVPSKIEMLTGNAATPALCFFSPAQQRGFILLTEQRTRFGNAGLFIEENAQQNAATFVVSTPGVRERAAGFGDFRDSGDTGAEWKAGDEVVLRLRLYSFPARDIPELLQKFMEVRKSLTGPNHPRNLTPFSAVRKFSLDFQNAHRWYEHPTGSFFRSGNWDKLDLGWVGGLIGTFPQLALDEAVPRQRVFANIDTVVNQLQGQSGYFYTLALNGKREDERPESPGMALTRRNADALFWLTKHLLLLRAQRHADLIKPEWETAARRLAQAFVRTWKKEGEFGNYVHPDTGEIVIFNSTSGAMAPAGLALAGQYFREPEFLDVAQASARFYYERDVLKLGLTGGGCADILQDPDCESSYGFLCSLVTLYDVTGDAEWLKLAKTVANLGATWTVSYDYQFPPGCSLNNLKANIAGAVYASVQNKHAAPGICTTSADYLFKLYRATGERCYAELLRDIIHAHAEVMETPGRVTTGMGPGSSMERITLADGEGRGAIGQILHTSNGWTEDNGMLMALENPGIYLRTDRDEIVVFDHVEVRVVERSQTGTTLEITNPTRFDAEVTLLAESAPQAAKPLGCTAFMSWPKVDVKAGGTVRYTAPPDPSTKSKSP